MYVISHFCSVKLVRAVIILDAVAYVKWTIDRTSFDTGGDRERGSVGGEKELN